MSVLKRGANVALTREIPGLAGLVLGVRWNTGAEKTLSEHLVVATILCDNNAKAISDEHFVFFNQLTEPSMSVQQLTHAVGDDHEQIEIHFAAVPDEISRIVVVLYVNETTLLRRSLGQLREVGVRVLDLADNRELIRSDNLAPSLAGDTAMSLGEVYRHNGDWKFRVIGESYRNGITDLAKDYGITL